MALYRDEAVVLRTYRLGEADRIVVLFTKGRGKVRAVGKGVRKTTSRFGARLEPTSHVALQLFDGRNLDTITQAETLEHFRTLREDLERITRASAMLEAVDSITIEREPNAPLYTMLLGALRALAGVAPMVEACVVCGAAEPLCAFSLDDGGVVCETHRRGVALPDDAIVLLQLILGGRVAAALAQPVTAATTEIEHLATRAMEYHLERRIRSIRVLDRG